MQSAFFPAQQQRQQHNSELAPTAQTPPTASSQKHKSSPAHNAVTPYAPPAAGSIGAAQHNGRAVRFPSSRRYLWDATAAGPQVLVDVLVSVVPHPTPSDLCI